MQTSRTPVRGCPTCPTPQCGSTTREPANNPALSRACARPIARKGNDMAEQLKGKKIAFAVANEGAEQVELTRPWEAVTEAGAEAELIAPEEGRVQACNHLGKGDSFDVDHAFSEADASEYDGLVLPGGVANPDQLRT